MNARILWLLFLTLVTGTAMSASVNQGFRVSTTASLNAREKQIWRVPVHNSEFADVPRVGTRSACELTHPPEALATPNPMLGSSRSGVKVKVSFIVGTDGRVHSPLIMESAGGAEDHAILETVRAWRYRPAMCNGIPTETEGRIEFSSR